MRLSNIEKKILFILVFFLEFFGLIFIPINNMIRLTMVFVLLYISLKEYRKEKTKDSSLIVYFCLFVLFSCVFSYIYNHQDLLKVIARALPYFAILSYFILKRYNLDIGSTRRIIMFLMFLMTFLYIVQWVIYPIVLFDSVLSTQVNDDRGLFRMRFTCSMCSYLLLFWGLNQFYTGYSKKAIMYSIMGGIPVLIMGFRSLIALCLVSLVGMLFFCSDKLQNYIKYVVVLGVLSIIALQTPLVQYKIDEMMTRQASGQDFGNEDYVRNIALGFYEDMYDEKPIMHIIGGGIPLISRSDEGVIRNDYQARIYDAASVGLLWNDLGLIGLSYMIGIPAVLLLVIICLRLIIKCKDPTLQYIRFTIIVVVAGSIITTQELYREGNLLLLGVLVYYLEIYNKNYENRNIDVS